MPTTRIVGSFFKLKHTLNKVYFFMHLTFWFQLTYWLNTAIMLYLTCGQILPGPNVDSLNLPANHDGNRLQKTFLIIIENTS
jgi:hypothetical protein